jgi:hypothetical protein
MHFLVMDTQITIFSKDLLLADLSFKRDNIFNFFLTQESAAKLTCRDIDQNALLIDLFGIYRILKI